MYRQGAMLAPIRLGNVAAQLALRAQAETKGATLVLARLGWHLSVRPTLVLARLGNVASHLALRAQPRRKALRS